MDEEKCIACGEVLSMSLSNAFATVVENNISTIIKCSSCEAYIGQLGYCRKCDNFTLYMPTPFIWAPNKAVCSKCNQPTFLGIQPVIFEI